VGTVEELSLASLCAPVSSSLLMAVHFLPEAQLTKVPEEDTLAAGGINGEATGEVDISAPCADSRGCLADVRLGTALLSARGMGYEWTCLHVRDLSPKVVLGGYLYSWLLAVG
jgi:hypothetical protein